MKIYRFVGEYDYLSNFYPCTIIFEGIRYSTVEHAYVASKTLDKQFRKKIAHLTPKDAGLVKKLGRKCKLRPGWKEIKLRLMKDFLIQKYTQDEFKKKLLETGDQELIEGNYWHDNYWGDCLCEKCESIEGLNHLGKLIMDIRDKITKKKDHETICYSEHVCYL